MGYEFSYYADYDYSRLKKIRALRRLGKGHEGEFYSNCIMMLDTETSAKSERICEANHIVAWTLSIRAKHENICTLWGKKPRECINTLFDIINNLDGNKYIIYVHNLAYDYVFLRKYLFEAFGKPVKCLNTKPHYPISIEFENGLILKDSLILAQKSLEKWAIDLDVEHKKATGYWDYSKLRNQDDILTLDELEYIEHDTLAGVECIDKLMGQLHHYIYSMPLTATGIVREEAIKRGMKHGAKERFLSISPSYDIYLMLEKVFHGGYTHANRHFVGQVMEDVTAYDFTSDYPFQMLANKFPMTRFTKFRDASIDELISLKDKYAFICHLILIKPCIKSNDVVMPVLQTSKCDKTINAVVDNGRILCADLVDIFVSEQTLAIIREQYGFTYHICTEVYYSAKAYLPRWYTDYVFELFQMKTTLKGKDLLNYMISKGKLNSTYGMCVQRAIQEEIEEDYERNDYIINDKYNEEEYNKYLKNRRKILPYQWGVWVTEYALTSLYKLGSMCEYWIYSDTDSAYGIGWDEKKVEAYNNECLEKLKARGYDAIEYEGKRYILGSAELDGRYQEFKTLGAKRYAVRDMEGKLKITVAGVPKKGVKCLQDDINNFQKGFVFDGKATGKLQHTYIYCDEPYIDKKGNDTADSIDLSPCDYLLDEISIENWEELFVKEIGVNVYDEEGLLYVTE